ncbi:CU044_2847 family protein [Streptomyces niveus]|uniref:CU044_2847 family protein n=1 Tax=Streptomyces niveus TaxID=193462 RepID=UPI00386717A9
MSSETPGLATDALRTALKPLGPLAQQVRDALCAPLTPPSEIAATFGIQVGQDLKFGIVNASGPAHSAVTATWPPEGTGGGVQGSPALRPECLRGS